MIHNSAKSLSIPSVLQGLLHYESRHTTLVHGTCQKIISEQIATVAWPLKLRNVLKLWGVHTFVTVAMLNTSHVVSLSDKIVNGTLYEIVLITALITIENNFSYKKIAGERFSRKSNLNVL